MRVATALALSLAVVFAVSSSVSSVSGQEMLEDVSFRPPFDSYDAEGQRDIPKWQSGGSVDINENFVRLTPDRASKRGYLWAKNPLPNDQWTATIRFRVSGQGKRLFGDGFGLWFTQHQYHVDGPIHGFADTFVGFGILFDTFRNTEAGHVHKDVALIINNNEAMDGVTQPDTPGCDGDFRYWEGRDDFSVSDSKSTAKITYVNGRVSVALDAKNTGDFATCIQDVPLNLPANWNTNAYLGVTSTTGQLADNHDLLSILVSPVADTVLPEHPVTDVPADLTTGNPQIDAVVAAAVAKEVKKVTDKLQHLHHHLEHQLSSVHDSLKHNVKKLQNQEADSVLRIEELETRLASQVEAQVEDTVANTLEMTLEQRMDAVERELNLNIKHHVDATLDAELDDKVGASVQKEVSNAGRGWLMPFFLLTFALVGVAVFGWKKYRDVMKTHLL